MIIQVPPMGSTDSKIAIIGEAPGSDEARLRKPFVGIAGRELDKMLSAAAILRMQCYITNVVKTRPPNNDITKYLDTKPKRVFMSDEYKEYEAYLYKEIKSLDANVLVPVGNTALWALCRKKSIMLRRGSMLRTIDELGNRKVIPTWHPAALLRNPILRFQMKRDLDLVKEEQHTPDITLPERNLITRPTYDECLEYLHRVREQKQTAYDIECVNYELSCICFTLSPTDAISIPFKCASGDYFHHTEEEHLMREIASILEDPEIEKIGQNLYFDNSFMFEKYGIITQNYQDTMIAHKILFPDFGKNSLAFMTSMFTKEPYYKDEGKDGKLGMLIDEVKFWEYNAKDGCVTHEIWLILKKQLERQGNWQTYYEQVECIDPLIFMQIKGLRLDTKSCKEESIDIDFQMEELYKQLEKMLDRELPRTFANSPKQLKDYFYREKKIPSYKNKGKVTCDGDALKRIKRKGFPEAGLVMEIVRLRKLKGTYLDVALDPDNRLRGSWNPIGTETTRFSCSKLWRG